MCFGREEDRLDGWIDMRTSLPGKFFPASAVPNRDTHLAGWEAGAEEKMLLGLTHSQGVERELRNKEGATSPD